MNLGVGRVSEELLREGETVLLWHSETDSVLLPLRSGPHSVPGRGVVDLAAVIGKPPGEVYRWAGANFRVLRPSLGDRLAALRRKAQIVTPKDAAQMLFLAGVLPGARIAEAGSGSGWLTVVLACSVGAAGRVRSYDRRPEFLDFARANVVAAGYGERVEFEERDVAASGFDQSDFDAILLDLPEPWEVVGKCRDALRLGGGLATYTPTYNQLERTVRALRESGFHHIVSEELLLRTLEVGEGGTRPAFEMLGHTGFLTGARWMGPSW
ncbi:MAG: tRNA (adenine-N1)-methyltransferase [Thermoplasmata archaeon]|nr:tRNA (adenine-N1)-methyltransferase [Thermoplasmata archaeon]